MSSVRVDTVGAVGYLTLTNPSTLNALTLQSVEALHAGLRRHESDSQVALIVLRSEDPRAFCAGGDMKQLRQFALDGRTQDIARFFEREYAFNLAVSCCSKPYLSIIDGIAMGGGLGLSVHGTHVVVTEHALLAMPESRIGFFPDVGASHFMPGLTHRSGYWMALTAASVRACEAVQIGLATHCVSRSSLPALMTTLEQIQPIDVDVNDSAAASTRLSLGQEISRCLDNLLTPMANSDFEEILQLREAWFSACDQDSIRQALQEASHEHADAATLLTLLDSGSPYALRSTLQLFAASAGKTLGECLDAEYQLALEACQHPDFVEGIRAVLVDKDKNPVWQRTD